MRRDLEQDSTFTARFEDQVERALLEIPDAAMDQARRMRGCARAEVGLVDERSAEPAQCGFARNPRPRYAAADDEYIHGRLDHGRPGCGSRLLQLPSTWGWW